MIRHLMGVAAAVAAVAALAVTIAPCRGDSEPKDYVAGGKLKHALEIRDVQGGFAGFTGKMWKIETDGKWTMGSVFNEKVKEMAKGRLTGKQLEALAKDLARFDLAGLKSQGKESVNPHVVTVKWGKNEATLILGAGSMLPKADAKGVEGRYSGVLEAVQKLAKAGKAKNS